MKKFISMLMVLCMLMSMAPVGLVSATGESAVSVPEPYFQLGFGEVEVEIQPEEGEEPTGETTIARGMKRAMRKLH